MPAAEGIRSPTTHRFFRRDRHRRDGLEDIRGADIAFSGARSLTPCNCGIRANAFCKPNVIDVLDVLHTSWRYREG
jgi:hypothetical protein